MTQFFYLIYEFIHRLLDSLNYITFDLMGYNVTLLQVLFAFFFLGFTISIFWRGAKS